MASLALNADRAAGLGLVLMGVAVALEAMTFEVAFFADPIGPGALPLLAAAGLIAAGVLLVVRPSPGPLATTPGGLRRIWPGATGFFLYAFCMPWLGFLMSTALLMGALSRLFGASLRAALISGPLLSVTLWLLFDRLLALPLPVGELWTR